MSQRMVMAAVALGLATKPGFSAPGECTVPADCTVLGARCHDQRCTIASPQELFPNVPGLVEIDLVEPSNLAATVDAPSFRWTPPAGVDLVVVAVMRKPPEYHERPDQISNFGEVVWIWHSALPGGSVYTNALRFGDGRASLEGAFSMVTPLSLASGAYYWGVWAWRGLALSHRSELRTFVVDSEDLTGQASCGECNGPSTARCLQRSPIYCVIACASNVDCYQGMLCDLSNLTTRHPWGVCRPSLEADCQCGDGLCDPELHLCYRAGVAARNEPEPSTAGCEAAGSPGALLPALIVWLAFARRRSGRR